MQNIQMEISDLIAVFGGCVSVLIAVLVAVVIPLLKANKKMLMEKIDNIESKTHRRIDKLEERFKELYSKIDTIKDMIYKQSNKIESIDTELKIRRGSKI